MIAWFGAAFLVIGFLVLMRLFWLVENSQQVISVSRQSLQVMQNAELDDEVKEKTLQQAAKHLLYLFLLLVLGGAGAALIPLGLLWIAEQLSWLSLASVYEVSLSPVFLIVSGIVATVACFLPRSQPAASQCEAGDQAGSHPDGARPQRYSAVDRSLHNIAFNTLSAQVALADLEDRWYAKQLEACLARRPVFIAGLPRAGTTLLLECFASSKEFATHCYRDMPFVMIPCLWNRFAQRFHKSGTLQERAHGDGMLISFDSPEALEEMIWKTFWSKHYLSDRILPWDDSELAPQYDESAVEEFVDYFRSHQKKIVLLRRPEQLDTARYVSKNNLNIARLKSLKKFYPDATVLVPFRHPVQHAHSLLTQHRNFLSIHEQDPFACKYMKALGHYEFGKNLRPINFSGWIDQQQHTDAKTLGFWLEYWVATYRSLLERVDPDDAASRKIARFVGYETLCEHPQATFESLADEAGCNADALTSAGSDVRPLKPKQVDTSGIDSALLDEAESLYARLCETG